LQGLNPSVPSMFRGWLLGFVALSFSMVESLAPRKTNLEDQASVFISPTGRVAQLYPQAPGTHFIRLLRHSWATLGLLPGQHGNYYACYILQWFTCKYSQI
jgi:hypothetical protein